jgi:hypothetical protein
VAHSANDGLVWTLETTHFPAPVTRWSSALFTTMQSGILAELMSESGVLLDGLDFREIDGRIYVAVVPLGGRASKPPPRWLVPILCRTVPLLRQRLAAAHAWDVTDRSGQVVDAPGISGCTPPPRRPSAASASSSPSTAGRCPSSWTCSPACRPQPPVPPRPSASSSS